MILQLNLPGTSSFIQPTSRSRSDPTRGLCPQDEQHRGAYYQKWSREGVIISSMQAMLKYSKTDCSPTRLSMDGSSWVQVLQHLWRDEDGDGERGNFFNCFSRQTWAAIHRHLDHSLLLHEDHIVSQTLRQFGLPKERSIGLQPSPGISRSSFGTGRPDKQIGPFLTIGRPMSPKVPLQHSC